MQGLFLHPCLESRGRERERESAKGLCGLAKTSRRKAWRGTKKRRVVVRGVEVVVGKVFALLLEIKGTKGRTRWVGCGGKWWPGIRSGSSVNKAGWVGVQQELQDSGEFLSLLFHVLPWDACGNGSWPKPSPPSARTSRYAPRGPDPSSFHGSVSKTPGLLLRVAKDP